MRTVARDRLAWLPIALSLVALVELVAYVTLFGVAARPGPDESAAARVFQFLLLATGIAMVVFAIRWLPRAPRATAALLAVHVIAATVPIATVLLLESGAPPG